LPSISIEQNGYMNQVDEEGSFEKELYDRLGVEGCFVAAAFGIDEVDCPVYVLDSTFGASMEIQAPATGIITLNGSWGQGQGGHRGYRLHSGEVAATGPLAGVDFGVAGTVGGEGYLFVHSITGTALEATIALQSATTQGGTYSNLATFTVSAPGAYKVSWAGASNRWLRASVTNLGGATAIEFSLVACVRGVTE
jgi:hypothetical protein